MASKYCATNCCRTLFGWVGPIVLSAFLLAVRIIWGWQFHIAGKGKLGNIDKPIGFFHDLNIPFATANAWFVSCLECFGGLLLLVGLFSRPVALMLTINMIVAYVTADREAWNALFHDGDVTKFSAAAPFWFLVASALVLGCGPGMFSIDAIIKRLFFRRPNLADRLDE